MKTIAFLLLASIPFVGMSQSSDYKIASFLTEGTKAPNTHYIGEAWLNSVLQADDDINYNITKATFRANSTLDWHKHPTPQVLIIVEGEGYYQERGKEPIILKKIVKYVQKKIKGGKFLFGKIQLRSDEPIILYPDLKYAKKFLKWYTKVNFSKGLNKTILFYKNTSF